MEKLIFIELADVYLVTPANGLLQQYGAATSAGTIRALARCGRKSFEDR